MTREIQDRKDIQFLIETFYGQVQVDEDIGPIFNQIVNDWPKHIQILTDFWQMNLLGDRIYKGHPAMAHIVVDRGTGNGITQSHFSVWLSLWNKTIDTHFHGEHAETAKRRARKMSTFLYFQIALARK